MVKPGDIIWLDFDPAKGHEQQKIRPALVVSGRAFADNSSMTWLCPISHANDYPLHINLPDNLLTDGKVLCEHLRSVDVDARGYKHIEAVPEEFLTYIQKILVQIIEEN